MCQHEASVDDAQGETPLNAMGYRSQPDLVGNNCRDVNRLNVHFLCVWPTLSLGCLVPARPA